jgi:hypothetical protein
MKSPERYTPDEAMEEALKLQEKVESGEAKNYDEAEKKVDSDKGTDKFRLSMTEKEREILEKIPQVGKKLIWERSERTFYGEFLPTIIGGQFESPRGYGHAKYEIIGDHSAWKKERDAQKVYFHYEGGKPVFTGNQVYFQKTFCIAIKRLGGYDGPPSGESLEDILSGFSPVEVEESSKRGGKNR